MCRGTCFFLLCLDTFLDNGFFDVRVPLSAPVCWIPLWTYRNAFGSCGNGWSDGWWVKKHKTDGLAEEDQDATGAQGDAVRVEGLRGRGDGDSTFHGRGQLRHEEDVSAIFAFLLRGARGGGGQRGCRVEEFACFCMAI